MFRCQDPVGAPIIMKPEAEKYVKEAFELWAKRSQKPWTLDISYLKDYGIEINGIKQKL